MSGHSKWAQIKHQKGITDKRRGVMFSKLCAAITAAAKSEADPNFNPRLRSAIEKAKEFQVSADNIARAVKRASEAGENLEELIFEAYGPGGAALLIEAISDNRDRTVAEIRHLIAEHGGKWAESGSVRWAFVNAADERGLDADSRGRWRAKFPQALSEDDAAKLKGLVEALEEHDDVQRVFTNATSQLTTTNENPKRL